MDGPIKTENGILSQIKKDYYYTGILTKKGVFNFCMDLMEDFYKEYPYAVKCHCENSIREILDYYD